MSELHLDTNLAPSIIQRFIDGDDSASLHFEMNKGKSIACTRQSSNGITYIKIRDWEAQCDLWFTCIPKSQDRKELGVLVQDYMNLALACHKDKNMQGFEFFLQISGMVRSHQNNVFGYNRKKNKKNEQRKAN